MTPMYRRGPAAVIEDSAAAEADFVRVTAISRSVPVTVVVKPAVPEAGLAGSAGSVVSAGLGSAGSARSAGSAEAVKSAAPQCSDDPDLFFAESPVDVELAKSICGGCPVRTICLAGAIERREPWGVWGGELFIRGEIVPRKRARGRPRKDEVAA
jgi:WhiB family transcriptional regulator, redox-sensing transcriptional regulator